MTNWKKLHAIIEASSFDKENKEADKHLVYFWDQFKAIKGKTFGDIIKKCEYELNCHPSFLAIACNTAEDYIKRKYS